MAVTVLKSTAVATNLLADMEAAKTAAEAAETNAATSETNAATSETNAATSETNAAASETAAATSETNAAASESAAAVSAASAANYAASIDVETSPPGLRSLLTIGADIDNEWDSSSAINNDAGSVTENADGTYTLADGAKVEREFSTAPSAADEVCFAFVVISGDARFIESSVSASSASTITPRQVEVGEQGSLSDDAPVTYFVQEPDAAMGGLNLVAVVENNTGAAVTITKPVLQFRRRLMVPVATDGFQPKSREVKKVGANTTLLAADSGRIVYCDPGLAVGAFNITVGSSVGEGFTAKIINGTTATVTLVASGLTLQGDGNDLATQHTRCTVEVVDGILYAHGDLT